MVPTPHEIEPGTFYLHVAKHRNQTPGAGLWTISESDERACFSMALQKHWLGDTRGWGLHINEGLAEHLGRDRYDDLSFVAKFVDENLTGTWHGYPKAPADVPSTTALADWLRGGFLRKKTVKLLSQGRPCNL